MLEAEKKSFAIFSEMTHVLNSVGLTTITDVTDSSKAFGVNLTSATTNTTTTLTIGQTADRTWTVPDVSSTFVGTDATQIISNKTIYEPTTATVSAAGTNQATATALTSMYNIVTTVAASTGVRLPVPVQSGLTCSIVNRGANLLNIYPASGGAIDALGTNAPFTLVANGTLVFRSSSTTQWYSVGSYGIGGGAGVTSVTGTANQVTAAPATGAVVVSTPSTFLAPGTIQDTTGMLYSTSSGLTGTGTNQATALAITKSYNVFSTVALNTGAILPTPSTGGYVCVIYNNGANNLNIYPNVGGQINTQGTNIAYQVAPLNFVTFIAETSIQWFSAAGISPGSGLSALLTEINTGVTFTTSSTSDVLITSMTYTIPISNPISKCLVIFNGSGGISSSGVAEYSVYYTPPAGVASIIPNSQRAIQPPGSGARATVATQAIIGPPLVVGIGGVIEIRVRRLSGAGTVTVDTRSMAVLGVA